MKTRKFNIDLNFLKVCSGIHMHRLFRATRSTADLCFNAVNSGKPGRTKNCPEFIAQDKSFFIDRMKWLFRTGKFGLSGKAI